MALPIYQQTRQDVPCEWVYDDTLDHDVFDDLPAPDRWDVFLAHFWWIAAGIVFGTIGYLAVMLP